MSASLFISYRREDTHDGARLLANALNAQYGQDSVFFDTRSIEIGSTWPDDIAKAIGAASVVLVVMGKEWFAGDPVYNVKRIEDEQDWVHREVFAALNSKTITTIPVLLNLSAPPVVAYPERLRKLAALQAHPIRRDHQEADTRSLIEKLDEKFPDLKQAGSHSDAGAGKPDEFNAGDAGFNPTAYRQKLAQQSQDIKLLGATKADFSVPSSLPRVYVPAMTQAIGRPATVDKREGGKDAANAADAATFNERAKSVTVMSALHTQSILLSGNPGSGKSTFAQWLVHCISGGTVPGEAILAEPESLMDKDDTNQYRESLESSLIDKLPVWIPLREFWRDMPTHNGNCEWSRGQLENALSGWLQHRDPAIPMEAFSALLSSGKLLLVLDGMDEVPVDSQIDACCPHPRHALITGLAKALSSWHEAGCRVLITSRPYGLESRQRQQLGLAVAELLPLDAILQHHFVHRWYRATDAVQPEQEANSLAADLGKRRELSHLSSNPLLLAAICVKYREGKALPEDIHDLFDSIVNQAIYSRYPQSAQQRRLIRARLTSIAKGMQMGWKDDQPFPEPSVDQPFLIRVLAKYIEQSEATETGFDSASQILEELLSNSGLLVSSGDDRVQFYHQDFRDFLAAERWHSDGGKLADALTAYADISDWREMLKFLFARNKHTYRVDDVIGGIEAVLPSDTPDVGSKAWCNRAKLVAECYGIAFGESKSELSNSRWAKHLRGLCTQALESGIEAAERNQLWLALGALGWDARTGIGLTGAGIPDIDWVKATDAQGKPFQLSRYLITHAQYAAFIDADDGYGNPQWWDGIEKATKGNRAARWIEPNAPRESISWYEAVAFCRWLSERLGVPTVRLPTSSEWASAYVNQKQEFPWEGEADAQRHANFDDTGINRTSAVGLFPAGAGESGALDMAGNVWEWCLDKYSHDDQDNSANAEIDLSEEDRVLRGGAFFNFQDALRASLRHRRLLPVGRNYGIGFRVLCRPH